MLYKLLILCMKWVESETCGLIAEMQLSEPEAAQLRSNLSNTRRITANTCQDPGLGTISLRVWVLACRGLEPNWLQSPARAAGE